MSETIPTEADFKKYFSTILGEAGYCTMDWELVKGMTPVVLAENPYYLIAFQVFDLWPDLIRAAGQIELALSEIISKQRGTAKVWDAYLVLVCRTDLNKVEEFNEFSNLAYNTERTRKIVRTGLGDSLISLQEVAKPFVSLTKVRSTAKGRDPLRILAKKMTDSEDIDPILIDKLITVFREQGNLNNV